VKSVLSEKVTIKESERHCKGIFAIQPIKANEIAFIKGGHILKREQLYSSGTINSYYPIDDRYFLGAMCEDDEDGTKLYINHSCNPNCGIRGEITFVAIRDIDSGEELTIDYAFVDNEDYSFHCNCGSSCCRTTVTGFDWKHKEIQDKYFDYFAAYLKEKILEEKQRRGESDI
jgi:hypothetical protein